MFEHIPEYTGIGEKVKNPKNGAVTTNGVFVSNKCIDPELLYKLAMMGASNRELGSFFDIPEAQIRYYFTQYLEKARSALKIKLRRAQLKVAIENENPTMLIWLGKNILGQTDSPIDATEDKILPWVTGETQTLTPGETQTDTQTESL